MVVQVDQVDALNEHIYSADPSRLFVLDFYADWCPPCRAIAPFFEQLSTQFKNATFLKINVDIARQIVADYQIRAMPTFVFVKQGREVARVQGANQEAIVQAIQQHHVAAASSSPLTATEEERQFLSQFVPLSEKVRYYTDIVNKTLALSLIPTEKLISSAETEDGKIDRYKLAEGLLQWFKADFFSWCDSPVCPDCGEQTAQDSGRPGEPSPEEKEFDAQRVEVYDCEKCHRPVRFPRYNNPAKLLETRTGRCGEWANCFALCAAAMDFEVRYIYDVTDHVWCELWMPEMNKWVHCDPCENALDTNYLYSEGWKKKVSYILAIGFDHVVDVTWSYSYRHRAVLKRRTKVREPVLASFIEKLSKRVAASYGVDDAREKELRRRRFRELIEHIHIGPPTGSKEQHGGRTTGNAAWRTARGELGQSPKKKYSVVLRPNDEELDAKLLKISYNTSRDSYYRGASIQKHWFSYLYKSKDVMRKVEADWKMSYLCRKEDKDEGEITWAVDLTGVKALKATVRISGVAEYESGHVALSVCADDICLPVPKSGELVVKDPPSALLKITANFTGGNGNSAFQHAQLFRCPLNSTEDQFVIEIELA